MKNSFSYLLLCLMFTSCSAKVAPVSRTQPGDDVPVAFPGAEGFGKYTTGGRGGKVMIVSNLNDDGEGSLRAALSTKQPVIVVFTISGTVHLRSPLNILSNTTIAGQSAPGDGICIADQPVILKGDNVIIRYMRFRMGDRYQNKGKIDGAGGDDAFGGTRRSNIIIDHCTMSWSTDEAFSIYAGDSTTLQWNLISEPLNYSYHFEEGDKDFERHGYGGILGGRHISIHHNLYAHCQSRTPRFEGNRHILPDTEFADYRNNVIYNWGGNNVYGGEGGNYNIVGNYYKYGPNTNDRSRYQVVNPFKGKDIPYGKYFVDKNYVDGSLETTLNNWLGVVMDNGTKKDAEEARQKAAFPAEHVDTHAPVDAYDHVLEKAGASFRRDTLDQRIITDVKNRTGRIIDVQGGFAHGTAYETTVNAWPSLKSLPAPVDTDKDGIPDDWEKKNGLNANDPSDAAKASVHRHYTNIEVYLNEILK
jgi:pectate lyase